MEIERKFLMDPLFRRNFRCGKRRWFIRGIWPSIPVVRIRSKCRDGKTGYVLCF